MKRQMVLPFAILAAVPFIMVLGNSMIIPVLPLMEQELDLTTFQVGLLVTAFSIPAGIVIPFAGALSDHIGRKRIMFPALLLYGLGGLGAGIAALWLKEPYAWMMVGRVAQGIGAGGTYQIALALTGDLFSSSERTKAVGILEAANGLGKMISPVAGAALGLVIWFAPFFAYGILAIPIAFLVWFLVKEPEGNRAKQSAQDYLQSLKRIFSEKGGALAVTYFAGAVGLFLLFGLLSFLSDVLEEGYDITGVTKGLYLAIPVTAMTMIAYLSGLFFQKRENLLKPALVTGLGLAAGGLVGLAFFEALLPMMILTSVMGLGIGLKLPPLNSLITGATRSEERGLITALYGTVRFFGVALGPPAFGLVEGVGRLPMFLAGAAIGAVALILILLFVRPKEIMVSSEASEKSGRERAGQREGSQAAKDSPKERATEARGYHERFEPEAEEKQRVSERLHDECPF